MKILSKDSRNDPDKILLEKCLKFLTYIAIDFNKPTRIFFHIYNFSSYYLLLGLALWKMITNFNFQSGIFESVEVLSFPIFAFCKGGVLVFKKSKIRKLLKDTEQFWALTDFDDDVVTETSFNLLRYLNITIRSFVVEAACGFVIFIFSPLLYNKKLPFTVYQPDAIPFYVLYIFQGTVTGTMYFYIIGFDILMCTMLIMGVIQFRLLNHSIKMLNLKRLEDHPEEKWECLGKINKIVAHHNFMIEYVQGVSEIISFTFFVNFLVTILTICIEMLLLNSSQEDFMQLVRGASYIFGMILEISLCYCIPAQFTLDEFEEITISVYATDWYIPNIIEIKKALLMIMVRTMKKLDITAEGYVPIDVTTILLTMKTAMSFYTFLSAVNDESV